MVRGVPINIHTLKILETECKRSEDFRALGWVERQRHPALMIYAGFHYHSTQPLSQTQIQLIIH
jgi:hypothetical protein